MTKEEILKDLEERIKRDRGEHIPKHFDDQPMSVSFSLGEWRTILNCIVNDNIASGKYNIETAIIVRELNKKMVKKYRRESRK